MCLPQNKLGILAPLYVRHTYFYHTNHPLALCDHKVLIYDYYWSIGATLFQFHSVAMNLQSFTWSIV